MGQGVGALNIYIYIYELIFCLFVVLQEVIFFVLQNIMRFQSETNFFFQLNTDRSLYCCSVHLCICVS